MALRTRSPILVFGETGQVAQELARLAAGGPDRLSFAGRARCDLLTADPGALILHERPQAVINASAYTAVDRAESEPEPAFRLNRDAPGSMARACAVLDIPFVHISTDYVFDGAKSTPYVESDPTGPVSVYGASKLAGEEEVAAAGGRAAVFRTAWVFSPFGANFVKTMLRLGAERGEVSVVDDQHGRPTLAADIARVALSVAQAPAGSAEALVGLYHLAGADDASWADLADRVFDGIAQRSGRRPVLNRIPTTAYPTPAKRPANSRLATAKLQKAMAWSPRPWRDSVDLCLQELA